jgi:cytochrome P450
MNPALSLPLERIVPSEGLNLKHEDETSTFLPSGTIVGINPWVFHRHPHIFGPEAESWNPDRWLTQQELETKSMEHALLTFGAGKRSCLGKNIAMLELFKIVPAMVLKFGITLANPEREWVVRNNWVLDQTGLDVKLKLR